MHYIGQSDHPRLSDPDFEYAFAHCSSLVDLTILSSVTHIERSAFENCSSLASLTIPDSVTHIEAFAFQNCISLGEFDHPRLSYPYWSWCLLQLQLLGELDHPRLGDLQDGAFLDCSSLANLTVPDSVTYRMVPFWIAAH